MLAPAREPAVVGVQHGPEGVFEAEDVMGKAEDARAGAPPPTPARGNTEGADLVQPDGFVQDVFRKVFKSGL